MTRFVTWDVDDKGGSSTLYRLLPTPKKMVEIYSMAVEKKNKQKVSDDIEIEEENEDDAEPPIVNKRDDKKNTDKILNEWNKANKNDKNNRNTNNNDKQKSVKKNNNNNNNNSKPNNNSNKNSKVQSNPIQPIDVQQVGYEVATTKAQVEDAEVIFSILHYCIHYCINYCIVN